MPDQDISQGVMMVAQMMAISARTAPKGKGMDALVSTIAGPDDLPLLSKEMERLSAKLGLSFFLRDAGNVAASDACVVLGIRGQEPIGINCQGCGYEGCDEMASAADPAMPAGPFRGPNCIVKITDLGIAIGSAVRTASIHTIDNRVMYSAGAAALSLGWLEGCTVAYGIPLKASGKNIFFDRK